MGIHSDAQHAIIVFWYAAKESFYLGVNRIGYAQRRFGYHALNPFRGDHSFRHCVNCVSGKVQGNGFDFHVVVTYQFSLLDSPIRS